MINNKIEFLIEDLPALPEIISLLLTELNSEDPDFGNIERLIYKDPFIATKILNLANSSYFNLFRKINNIGEALRYIGLRRLFNIVLMIGVSKSFSSIKDFDIYSFWCYSLNVSKLCYSLADRTKNDKETALTIGLIHAIGELILHLKLKDKLNIINLESNVLDVDRHKHEFKMLGYNYLDVTAAFIKQNRFSHLIVNTIREQTFIANNQIIYSEVNNLGLTIYLSICVVRSKESKDQSNIFIPKEVIYLLKIDESIFLEFDDEFWATKEDVAMII